MKRILAVVLGAATLLAGACGSDDDGVSSSDLSLDEWVEEANAVCAEAEAEADALGEPTSNEELLDLMDEALQLRQEQVDALEDLGVPSEAEDEVNRVFELLDEQLVVFPDYIDALADEDEEALIELQGELDASTVELDELAGELGLTACTSG